MNVPFGNQDSVVLFNGGSSDHGSDLSAEFVLDSKAGGTQAPDT